jgi:hypothetical protein
MVLAMSLFLGAITVLAQIVWNGQRAALAGRLRTEAAFRCESKLSEILAGAEPFQPQQNVAFPDDPQWVWSADISPGNYPELMQLRVIVQHNSENPAANAEFALERWTRDPSLFLEAAMQEATAAASSTTSSSSLGGSR